MAALLAACQSAPVTGRSQMMLVSESEERQMGLQAYQQVLSKEPLSYDAQTNALVEKVGRRIAAAAERPPNDLWRAPRFRWEFKTVDKNEPNAFCLPGGKVVVYTGILPITKHRGGTGRRDRPRSGACPGAPWRRAHERPDGGAGRRNRRRASRFRQP